jgi:hypothetical protein
MSATRRVCAALTKVLIGAALLIGVAAPASAVGVTLDNWKLQLPTSTGSGAVDEIGPAQLGDYQSEWFQRIPRGLALTTSTDGATTPNSQHSRSELREMTPAGEEAAWDPAVGVHHFAVRLAVTKLPDTEPEVVVAQAHNGDTGLPMIRLEGRHLFVAGEKSRPVATLSNDYGLGTPFTVSMTARDSRVVVSYNGRRAATVAVKPGRTYYFKTGAYEQSHVQGDGFAQVVILAGPVTSHSDSPSLPRVLPGERPARPSPRRSDVLCARNTLPPPLTTIPGPATTGYPAGALKGRINGDYTTQHDGEVVSNVRITGVLNVAHNNVTIKCSHITKMIDVKGGATGARVWLTTIGVAGNDVGGPAGIRNSDFTARRVEITGTTDGIRTTGPNVDFRDGLIWGLYDDGPAHNDAAQISTGSSNIIFARNRIDSTSTGPGARWQTSGMILFNEGAPVAIVGNLFTGKASTHINVVKAGKATKITNNIFVRTTRDAVMKGGQYVSAVGNVTHAVKGPA